MKRWIWVISFVVAAITMAFSAAPCIAAELNRQKFFVQTETGMKLFVAARTPQSGRVGQAVLLVHGSGVGWEYWDIPLRDYSIMDYLAAKGLDVYAVQCSGYGESTKPNGMEVTATSMAQDIKSVVTEIKERSGVSNVHLAGHSSGGTVLLVAAGLYPDLLGRMILIGAPYKKVNPRFVDYANKIIEMAKEPGKDYVPNRHHLQVEKRLDEYDEDIIAWYKKIVGEKYGAMPGGLYPDVLKNPGIPYVATMKVPTLVLNGSNEYVVDPEDAMDLFSDLGIPDKAFIIQPGGFHLMFLEKRGHVGLQESIFFWVTKQ